jgi:endonuclease/exonuclease/phosphatase family metal-dependent hydrolase
MAGTFKIGTFNCENLFSRPRVLNREDRTDGDEKMAKVELLRQELEKDVYDGPQIVKLYQEINTDKNNKPSPFIEIIELRNKLFSKSKSKGLTVKAKGRKDVDYTIEFKRDKFSDAARQNTAKVINTIDADIISLIEVEDKTILDSFNSTLIKKSYEYSMLIDAFDPRHIDVALLSRFPFEDIRTHMFEKEGKSRIFSRDCLEVKVKLADNDFIYFFVNHFKSQGYGTQQENDAKRLRQTQRVAEIIQERGLNLSQDKVVVIGDFNAPPESPTVAPLINLPGLKDVLELKIASEIARATYYYNKWEQIDFILVSKPLQDKCIGAGVERKGIYNLAKITQKYPEINEEAWKEVQDAGAIAAASDHGAVWAEFIS